jgi:hypothetical protein
MKIIWTAQNVILVELSEQNPGYLNYKIKELEINGKK